MSENQIVGRTASEFKPGMCEAVVNVTTYSFGTDAESTRADTVLRIPTAAIVLHCRGRILEYQDGGQIRRLPRLALLGPDSRARIWATRPNTEFMMVNLAPGAVRTLFDIAPASMSDQTESLRDHVLEELLLKCQDQGPAVLTRALCDFMKSRQGLQPGCFDDHRKRIHGVIRSLRDRVHGERVNDYADNFGITSRTLQRMVRAEVGLAPKQVLSTSRLRELISMTNGGWTRSAADLAQTGGYFDQSHLRHELQRLGFGSVSNLIGGDHLVVQR